MKVRRTRWENASCCQTPSSDTPQNPAEWEREWELHSPPWLGWLQGSGAAGSSDQSPLCLLNRSKGSDSALCSSWHRPTVQTPPGSCDPAGPALSCSQPTRLVEAGTRLCHHCPRAGRRCELALPSPPWCLQHRFLPRPLSSQVGVRQGLCWVCTTLQTTAREVYQTSLPGDEVQTFHLELRYS